MNKLTIARRILAFLFLLFSIESIAAVPTWQIVPAESIISFTGTQNGAPASGSFKKFAGEILFDPTDLKNNKVKIIVDMNSLTTSYSDLTATLLTADWFNIKVFPHAIFESSHFTKLSNNKYSAEGVLTIRDKKNPVSITFDGEESPKGKGHVKGSMTLKRSMFGVGQGEWADTNSVKDDVQVNFVITATQKK